tara:strand:- start:123 stop:326 length:204 start_codon:yes stop_codon:yes gene_type:complete
MSHLINHYVENKELIPMLLDYGWIIRNNTWTDCPLKIQKRIEKEQLASYFLGNNPKLVKQNQRDLGN